MDLERNIVFALGGGTAALVAHLGRGRTEIIGGRSAALTLPGATLAALAALEEEDLV